VDSEKIVANLLVLLLKNLLLCQNEYLLIKQATYPHNWCHKFNQETRYLEEGRVEIVQEVDQEALDMRTVVILFRH
jgi:hypothetical protein